MTERMAIAWKLPSSKQMGVRFFVKHEDKLDFDYLEIYGDGREGLKFALEWLRDAADEAIRSGTWKDSS